MYINKEEHRPFSLSPSNYVYALKSVHTMYQSFKNNFDIHATTKQIDMDVTW